MSQFPKAKPTKMPRRWARGPRSVRTHVAMLTGTTDWDGLGICDTCGFRADHRIHELIDTTEATALDARKLGEAGRG